ncbi:MAG: 30S ribosomal protein S7 [Anaeroplasmataceae bacterium]|nr:30S ribosomal protein S7 [Anaeroplasmataceae bacterium]MDE6241135.1 30S ribosomal protein S7 [Anaeroplasmataceae bacterium]MDE6656799.1 30S ribosomal protein S7 [Anaeroplasmataceae bacterium]MDE7161578.1 30S ribosomal protein S7 [Anaeroplasmataceae bacterium]
MPRKGHIAKRDVLPDPIYNSKVVTRTINTIMLDGKKGTAQTILYGAFDRVKEATGQDPLEVFTKALENIMPVLEVKSRRIGGQNYQVPVEVRPERKQTLGLRWLVKYARLRNDKTMEEKLAKEIMDAANGVGGACKKREDTHKMAEANRAFAHYRW